MAAAGGAVAEVPVVGRDLAIRIPRAGRIERTCRTVTCGGKQCDGRKSGPISDVDRVTYNAARAAIIDDGQLDRQTARRRINVSGCQPGASRPVAKAPGEARNRSIVYRL